MHNARMERRIERKKRIENYSKKRLIGEKRVSLFDEALEECLKLDRKIMRVFPIGRTRYVIVVNKIYRSFPLYPTGCNPVRLKEHQEKYPNIIFIPFRINEPVEELTKKIFSAIGGNGRNLN